MARHCVGTVDEIPLGERKIVSVGGREIGIFNVHGSYYALRNICPHQGAPLCLGYTEGTMLPSNPGEYILGRHGEILRCPWHGWEFDLLDGVCLFDPRIRVKTFRVEVDEGNLFLLT